MLAVAAISGCSAPDPGTAVIALGTNVTSRPGTDTPGTTGTPGTERPLTPPHVPPAEVVEGQELIALETQTGGPVGWRGSNRFVDTADWQRYLKSLASDGQPHPVAAKVPAVPAGKALVAATVAVGCDKPTGALLLNGGSSYYLVATGLPDEPTPECYAPYVTVAVVAAPARAVPAGRVGVARSMHFEALDARGPYRPGAIDLTDSAEELASILPEGTDPPDLPALADGLRRYAFLLTGCRADAAALEIDPTTVAARIDNTEYDPVECVVARPFLAVFDVADADVPPGARPTS
jgi:hypothetical protein